MELWFYAASYGKFPSGTPSRASDMKRLAQMSGCDLRQKKKSVDGQNLYAFSHAVLKKEIGGRPRLFGGEVPRVIEHERPVRDRRGGRVGRLRLERFDGHDENVGR